MKLFGIDTLIFSQYLGANKCERRVMRKLLAQKSMDNEIPLLDSNRIT